MPYSSIDEVPAFVRKKGEEKARQWMAVWNDVFAKTANEPKAFKAANAAISLSASDMYEGAIEHVASSVFPKERAKSGVYKVQVMRAGLLPNHPKHGDINITNADLATAVRNYRNSGRKFFLDFNHGITSGTTAEERKAIGWARDLYIEDPDGNEVDPAVAEKSDRPMRLFAEYQMKSADAEEKIASGEYALYSPTFFQDFMDEDTGEMQGFTVLGGAATNIPYFSGMSGFVAMSAEVSDAVSGKTKGETQDEAKGETKDETKGEAVIVFSTDQTSNPLGFVNVKVEVKA